MKINMAIDKFNMSIDKYYYVYIIIIGALISFIYVIFVHLDVQCCKKKFNQVHHKS